MAVGVDAKSRTDGQIAGKAQMSKRATNCIGAVRTRAARHFPPLHLNN
jgi:hypothetical protein